MLIPDSYIVRIYRRNKKNPRLIVGVVEQVGDAGWKAGFESAEEMQGILIKSGQADKIDESKSGEVAIDPDDRGSSNFKEER